MMNPRDRNLTLADAMILVGATALGLAAAKSAHGWAFEDWDLWSRNREGLVDHMLGSVGMMLAAWTVALLAMRLRSPRPSPLRLARQPGFVACLSASIGLGVVGFLVLVLPSQLSSPGPRHIGRNVFALPAIGTAVAASWAMLAIGGRWRPEPSWIDRAGRLLGLLWLVELGAFWAILALGVVRLFSIW